MTRYLEIIRSIIKGQQDVREEQLPEDVLKDILSESQAINGINENFQEIILHDAAALLRIARYLRKKAVGSDKIIDKDVSVAEDLKLKLIQLSGVCYALVIDANNAATDFNSALIRLEGLHALQMAFPKPDRSHDLNPVFDNSFDDILAEIAAQLDRITSVIIEATDSHLARLAETSHDIRAIDSDLVINSLAALAKGLGELKLMADSRLIQIIESVSSIKDLFTKAQAVQVEADFTAKKTLLNELLEACGGRLAEFESAEERSGCKAIVVKLQRHAQDFLHELEQMECDSDLGGLWIDVQGKTIVGSGIVCDGKFCYRSDRASNLFDDFTLFNQKYSAIYLEISTADEIAIHRDFVDYYVEADDKRKFFTKVIIGEGRLDIILLDDELCPELLVVTCKALAVLKAKGVDTEGVVVDFVCKGCEYEISADDLVRRHISIIEDRNIDVLLDSLLDWGASRVAAESDVEAVTHHGFQPNIREPHASTSVYTQAEDRAWLAWCAENERQNVQRQLGSRRAK